MEKDMATHSGYSPWGRKESDMTKAQQLYM